MTPYHAMTLRSLERETALDRFRNSLSEEDAAALDGMLGSLGGHASAIAGVTQFSPSESVLLRLILHQNRRLALVEFLLQRTAQREIELPQRVGAAPFAKVVESSPISDKIAASK